MRNISHFMHRYLALCGICGFVETENDIAAFLFNYYPWDGGGEPIEIVCCEAFFIKGRFAEFEYLALPHFVAGAWTRAVWMV